MHIRLHASRIDVSTDIDLSDSELEEDHWGPKKTIGQSLYSLLYSLILGLYS
jgi:hypothetical protein